MRLDFWVMVRFGVMLMFWKKKKLHADGNSGGECFHPGTDVRAHAQTNGQPKNIKPQAYIYSRF